MRSTGVLSLGGEKFVFFLRGTPVHVDSLDAEETSEVYLRTRIPPAVDDKQLAAARAAANDSGRGVGEALLGLGFLDPSELFEHKKAHAKQKLVACFAPHAGTVRFEPRESFGGELVPIPLDVLDVMREGLGRFYDRARLERELPVDDLSRVTVLPGSAPAGLATDEARLLQLAASRPTLRAIATAGGQRADEVRRHLYALYCLGLLGFELGAPIAQESEAEQRMQHPFPVPKAGAAARSGRPPSSPPSSTPAPKSEPDATSSARQAPTEPPPARPPTATPPARPASTEPAARTPTAVPTARTPTAVPTAKTPTAVPAAKTPTAVPPVRTPAPFPPGPRTSALLTPRPFAPPPVPGRTPAPGTRPPSRLPTPPPHPATSTAPSPPRPPAPPVGPTPTPQRRDPTGTVPIPASRPTSGRRPISSGSSLSVDGAVEAAELARADDDLLEALEILRAADHEVPDHPKVQAQMALTMVLLDPRKHAKEANRLAHESRKAGPALPLPYVVMGILLEQIGQREQAAQMYRHALARDPDCGDASRRLMLIEGVKPTK
jgi:hypothetical protein